jgi:hypothetical protein
MFDMPLNPSGAKTTLGNLFKSPVGSEATAIISWKNAILTLTAGVIPASTTVAAAAATLATSLSGFNASGAAAGKINSALVAFAATVAGGMAPAFTGVVPIGSPGVEFSNGSNAQAAADAIIDTIDEWLQTGTATPSGGGDPENWS